MIKRLRILTILVFGLLPAGLALSPSLAYADTVQNSIQSGVNQASGNNAPSSSPGTTIANVIKTILNILSAVAGVAAVVMIVVAGLRLVLSAGSEGAVKGAKNSIIYAVIGLIIVALAQIIVHFVIGNITTGASGSSGNNSNNSQSSSNSGYSQGSNSPLH